MSYLILFVLFLPIKLIGKLFYKNTGRNLLIQTAKIGDFVNVTPLLAHLKHSDVLISKTVLPLAKHATRPLRKPESYPISLDKQNVIKIGLSISAGNKSKTIPAAVWKKVFDALGDLNCIYYVFGPQSEQVWLDDLHREVGEREDIVSLIGELPLEDVPFAISKMDFYIASDSGNVYIADAVGVPIVLIYGPCCIEEQRPLGNVLLIGHKEYEKSYIFEAPYYFDRSREEMFALSKDDLERINNFIRNNINETTRR